MAKIDKGMESPELGGRALPVSTLRAGDELGQTLALIMAYANNVRVLLKASPSGVQYTAGPRLTDVFHWTAAAPNTAKQGDNIICTEVLCMAHPDNTGRIWVRTRVAATTANGFPLEAGEVIGFSVENLMELRALIVANGDTLIVGYSL